MRIIEMCLRVHNSFRIMLTLTHSLFLPMVAKDENFLKENFPFKIRKKQTKIIMKNQIIKFRVSKIEQRIIQKKSEKAGLSVSEFLRRLALEKEIKSRLTSEEIECYKTLSKYADNFRRISNLFKLGDVTGVKNESLETSKLIRNHIEKFK